MISIVIPTYNRGPRLAATLESALQQTLSPTQIEILVIDDGSTDGTGEWARAHYAAHQRIRVIQQENLGVAGARNRGLLEARGEFIAFLDHDDVWLPTKLEKQWAAFQNKPRLGVVYTLWQEVSENGNLLPGHDVRLQEANWNLPQGRVFSALVHRNFIISMSVPLIRTELLRRIGGFDPQTVPCDDWDVWLRLSRQCEFAYVREVLVHYHRHQNQMSSDEMKMWRASHLALFKHWKSLLFQPKALWMVLSYGYFLRTTQPFYHRARRAVAEANWHQVRRQILLCCLKNPLTLLVPQWLYVVKRLITRDARPF